MDPLTLGSAAKLAKPAVLAGYRALRHELSRRAGDDARDSSLFDLDQALDEAIAVLARESTSLLGAAKTGLKGLISRPAIFNEAAARDWIATELAQACLKAATIAAIRGEDDSSYQNAALDHYALFLGDAPASERDTLSDGEHVYLTALDFIRRSLKRELSLSDRLLLNAVHGVHAKIDRLAPADTGDLVDRHVAGELDRLRRARFFRSADPVGGSIVLARELTGGRFEAASATLKVATLSWCARMLAFRDEAEARRCRDAAERHAVDQPELLGIARAFCLAAGDWQAGLRELNPGHSALQATATFQILRHALGAAEAIERAQRAGIAFAALDPDGRYAFLTALIELERWDAAFELVDQVSPADLDRCPALLWVVAGLLTMPSVPEDLRRSVLQDIPMHPAAFPLAEDTSAIVQRRRAGELLERVASECEQLDLRFEARLARRYALWLQLKDPAQRDHAQARLRGAFETAGDELLYLPLALTFGLSVARSKAEALIEQRLALGQSADAELVSALLALLLDRAVHDPAHAATLVTRHRTILAEHLDPQSVVSLEANILTDAGRIDEARALVEQVDQSALLAHERSVLWRGAEQDPAELLAALEAEYSAQPHVSTLIQLVRRHHEVGWSERYMGYALELLKTLRNTTYVEDMVNFARSHAREEEALALIEVLGGSVVLPPALTSQAAWLYLRRGRLGDAERLLAELERQRDARGDRVLRFQLLLISGQWEALDAFLERQWQHHQQREADELAQCALLAAQIGAHRVADFIEAALAKGGEDPHLLVAAYNAATTAGLEDIIPQAGGWVMRAAALSDPEGPVQTKSLQEILDFQPDWDSRVDQAMKAMAAGSLPLEALARLLRRSWLELILTPLLKNHALADVRHKAAVPLYSGRRRTEPGETLTASSIALDRSALMTLAACDALDAVLDAFDAIHVPHDILADLFEQRGKVSFHQPSRIAFARQLGEFVARGSVHAFKPTVTPELDLVTEIGPSLAALLSEAAAQPEGQHLLVHPYPITRAGSLLSDPVPLDAYRAHLCSCQAVIDAVEQAGQLRRSEADQARSYLAAREQRWPQEAAPLPGATLYLSGLAVAHLRYTDMLGRIERAGFKVIVADGELETASALRDVEALSSEVDKVITRARHRLAAGIASGHVVLGAATAEDADEAAGYVSGFATLVAQSDLLVIDDRFLNRYENFEHGGGKTRMLGSIDLIECLASAGRISPAKLADIRAWLRRAGAMLVPVGSTELIDLLADTIVRPDTPADAEPEIVETGELRVLRESIRLVQLRGWLDPGHDAAWLASLNSALTAALFEQWTSQIPDALARARSGWLLLLLDSRDWSDGVVPPGLASLARQGAIIDLATLCGGPRVPEDGAAQRFEAWLDEVVMSPRFAHEPALRAGFLDHMRLMVAAVARDMQADNPQAAEPIVRRIVFDTLPQFVQVAMLEDRAFGDSVGFGLESHVGVEDANFTRTQLLDAVRQVYAEPGRPVTVDDDAGRSWMLTCEADPALGWPLRFEHGDHRRQVRGMLGQQRDAAARIAMLDRELASLSISPEAFADVRQTLAARQLEAEEIDAFETRLRSFPTFLAQAIEASFTSNAAEIELLAPGDPDYYARLVGEYQPERLQTYLTAQIDPFGWAEQDGFTVEKLALLTTAHPRVPALAKLAELDDQALVTLGEWVAGSGDLFAQVAFIETALPRAAKAPALERLVISMAQAIEGLDPEDSKSALNLISSLVMLVDGELSLSGALRDWPVYLRRLAVFAQAALIARQVNRRIDTARFAAYCTDQRGWRFFVQNLVDLRREPRWRPDYAAAVQLRHELIGRLVNASFALPDEQRTPDIAACFTADEDSLRSRMAFPMAFWPGPIEGSSDLDLQEAPPEICAEVEAGLAAPHLDIATINLLVNLQGTFAVPQQLLTHAVEKIRTAGPRLLAGLARDIAYGHLLGLAHLAACYRLTQLADTVRLFMRYYRLGTSPGIALEMQLALYVAAAHEAPDAWRDAVGDWVRELAAIITERADAELLLGWIDALCEIDPQLRAHTGRARAGLRLLADR